MKKIFFLTPNGWIIPSRYYHGEVLAVMKVKVRQSNLKRNDAIALSKEFGFRISHLYFTEDEWIRVLPHGEVICEDGCHCGENEFFSFRKEPYWEKDWEIVPSPEVKKRFIDEVMERRKFKMQNS